jgi:hypothetical protein
MKPTMDPLPPEPAIPRLHPAVRRRARRNLRLAVVLIVLSLLLGMVGFHFTGDYGLVESFSQAALLLGGEGPPGAYPNDPTRIFAGIYALYSGLTYIVLTALLLAPVFGSVLRRHHIDVGSTRTGA